jgi:hypothetical protein
MTNFIQKNKTSLTAYFISLLSVAQLSISMIDTKCNEKSEFVNIGILNSTKTNINIKCSDIQPAKLSMSALSIIMGIVIAVLDRSNLKQKLVLENDNKNLVEQVELLTQGRTSLNNYNFPINVNEPFESPTPASSVNTIYAPDPVLRTNF